MHRSVLSAVLAVALSLVACSDQPTEPRPGAISPPAFVTASCPAVVSASDIQGQIDQLYPSGSLRNSAQSQFKSIPPKITKTTGTAARDKTFALIDFTLKNYEAGKLSGGTSTATFDKVLRLIEALHCYVGMTPPSLPSTTAGSDAVVGVAFPNVAFNFRVPSFEAGVQGEATAVTTPMGPVLIAIFDLPNSPPPLRTTLDQYPRFYHFSGNTATGPVVFNTAVTAAVCLRAPFAGDPSVLRLAHNVGPNFGDVEVLPRPAAGPAGVTCPDLGGGGIGSIPGRGPGRFAWAEKLFLPAELHAASLAMIELPPVGGNTKRFSEFGIVDPGSNPASINFNPNAETFSELSAPPGTAVSPAPSVVVKSQNGTPIPNVPILFAVTGGGGTVNGASSATVTTNNSGIATVTSWVLGTEPSTNTLTATPPAVAQIGSPGTPPYNPAAVFNPLLRTFTAEAQSVGGGVITNGTVSLGVNPTGNLIVLDVGPKSSGIGDGVGGVFDFGLRYVPTSAEALAIANLSEGWGISYSLNGGESFSSGYVTRAGVTGEQTQSNMELVSFSRTADHATSVVRVGPLEITHAFRPIELTDNLYEVFVTIANPSNDAVVTNVVYRRVMDWDIEPTAFNEFVTLVGTEINSTIFGSNNGFASANPLTPRGSIFEVLADFFGAGPFDHGAVFDLDIPQGIGGGGGTNTFSLFYGAAGNRADAAATAALVHPTAVSLAWPSPDYPDDDDGSPNTFIFAVNAFANNVLVAADIDPPAEPIIGGGVGLRRLQRILRPPPSEQETRARLQSYRRH